MCAVSASMWGPLVAGVLALLAPARGTVVVYTQDIPYEEMNEYPDQPAAFGGKLPDEGLHGLLVVGEPRDGCAPLAPPPAANLTDRCWIVLLARYNCSFEIKVRNAQNAGYDCAIVHNVNSSELDTMTAKDPEGITIPSVFVGSTSGEALAEYYLYNQGFYIMVTGVPFDINTQLLLPFAIVVAICLLVMVGLMIVKCLRDRQHARRRRLPSRALKKIPTCKFAKGDPYDTCAICLDDYVEGERLRVLPCAHAYHAKCIDPWLTQSRRVCPVCKRRVVAAGERRARAPLSDSDSDDSQHPLTNSTPATQGGTFVAQRENPFVRAARFVTRQRRAAGENEQQQDEESVPANGDEETGQNEDTQPLIRPEAEPATSRRWWRERRRRRQAPSAPAPAPAPAPAHAPAPPPHRSLHRPPHRRPRPCCAPPTTRSTRRAAARSASRRCQHHRIRPRILIYECCNLSKSLYIHKSFLL